MGARHLGTSSGTAIESHMERVRLPRYTGERFESLRSVRILNAEQQNNKISPDHADSRSKDYLHSHICTQSSNPTSMYSEMT